MFLYSDLVTRILLGEKWIEASRFIGLWGLTSAITIIFSNFSSEVYRSRGKPRTSLLVQVLHLCFLVPTVLLAVNSGFEVLYVSRAVIRLQMVLCTLLIMHFRYGFKIISILQNTAPMLLSALIMAVVGFFLQQINSSIVWHLISVLICIAVYFVTLLGCFPKIRTEIAGSQYVQKILAKLRKIRH